MLRPTPGTASIALSPPRRYTSASGSSTASIAWAAFSYARGLNGTPSISRKRAISRMIRAISALVMVVLVVRRRRVSGRARGGCVDQPIDSTNRPRFAIASAGVDKPIPDVGRGHEAGVPLSKPAIAMPGDDPINEIPNGRGDQNEPVEQRPRPAEFPGQD